MARKKMSLGVVSLALIGLLLVGGLGYFAFSQDITSPTIANCPEATGKLTVNAVNALEKGTAVSAPTITAGVNGGAVGTSVTSGTTAFAVGDKVSLLVSKADYLDEKFEFTMTCGGYTLEAPLYYATSDNPAIKIKNSDGDYVTDAVAGGTVNQTNLNAGSTFSFDVEFQGTSLESSGNLVYVVEFPASSNVNITDVSISGGASKLNAIPSVHATQNAGSEVVAFEIPALVGSEKKVYTVSVSLASAKDLSGGVYTDVYAKQYFIDDDGSIKYGIQDASGDAKYENTLDFDFLIESA